MRHLKVLQVISSGLVFILVAQFVGQGQGSVDKKSFFNALRVIGTEREDKQTWPIIEEVFKSDEVGLRLVGIKMLSGRAKGIPKSRSEIIPFLAKVAMEDKNHGVRGRAMNVIAKYTKMGIVVEVLTEMITDEDEFNRQCALETIAERRVTKAIPPLKEAVVQEKNKKLKKKMAEAITLLEKRKHEEDDAELNRLLKQLKDPDPQKRHTAIAQLQVSEFEDSEKAVETLIDVYAKEDVTGNKMETLATLALIGKNDDDVISLIKEESNSPDKDIRDVAKALLDELIENKMQDKDDNDA